MRPSLHAAIRDHLTDYLRGGLTLREFDEWFVSATWNVEQTSDQHTIDLTDEIILRLADYSNGDCTETELKDLLRPLTLASPAYHASA